jgi:hypothetical protein
MRVATAGGPWSPARSIRRPSPSRRRTDRPGRLSCGFARIPSTFAGRAVPSGAAGLRTIPLRRWLRHSRHPSRASHRPCGFPASRLRRWRYRSRRRPRACSPFSGRVTPRRRRRPRGSFVPGVLRAAHVPGPRPGWFSRPGRWGRFPASPATSVGFAHHPSQCCSDRAGGRAFVGLAPGPTCRFAVASHREFHRSRDPVVSPVRRAVGVDSWVFAPRASLRHAAADLAIAFARRAERFVVLYCPGFLSHPSGSRLPTRVVPRDSGWVPVDTGFLQRRGQPRRFPAFPTRDEPIPRLRRLSPYPNPGS